MSFLKDNEVFLYRERGVPSKRSLKQFFLSSSIYPFMYGFVSNDFNREFSGREMRRILSKGWKELADKFAELYPLDPSDGFFLVSDDYFQGSYDVNNYKHIQRGVDEGELEKFSELLKERNVNVLGYYLIGTNVRKL